MNACGDKSIIMNRRVLCSWFLYQQWYRYLPAGKNTMYRNPLILGVPIFFVKRFQSCYYNGHPALLLRGPYRGTTATTIRTSTYTGIHSFQYGTNTRCTAAAVLSSNSCHCPEIMSTNIMPRKAQPVEQIINNTITGTF